MAHSQNRFLIPELNIIANDAELRKMQRQMLAYPIFKTSQPAIPKRCRRQEKTQPIKITIPKPIQKSRQQSLAPDVPQSSSSRYVEKYTHGSRTSIFRRYGEKADDEKIRKIARTYEIANCIAKRQRNSLTRSYSLQTNA